MRVRVPAVFLVSVLFLASYASAAFAQATIGDETTIIDCSQVQNVFANQGQYANANAAADDDSEAVAEVAQELNISQNQVNACLGNTGGAGGNNPSPGDDNNGDANNGGDDDNGAAGDDNDDTNQDDDLSDEEDEVIQGTVLADELPNTGGPSLLGIALGLSLVAGGLSLIRFRR